MASATGVGLNDVRPNGDVLRPMTCLSHQHNRLQRLVSAHAKGCNGDTPTTEIPMTALWIILAFWAGAAIGFGTFAALQMSRAQDERQLPRKNEYRYSAGC